MKSLNQCNFIGNLGNDPDARAMPNGNAVSNFSIAVSDDYTKDGQKVEQTEWVRVVAFGKLAEICNEYLKKGSKVFVTGKQKTRKYEKDGVTHYTTEIVANEMQMLDSKPNQATTQQSSPNVQQGSDQSQSGNDDPFGEDQVPF